MTTSLPTSASHPPSQMKPTTYSIDNSNQLTKPAPWQQWWHNCWCQWCQTQINHTGATTMHNMLIMLGMLTTNSLMMPSTLWPDPPSCTSHQPHTDSSLLTPYSALLCLTNTWKTWQSPARYHPALPECDPFIHHPWLHHNIYPTISNQDHLPCLFPLDLCWCLSLCQSHSKDPTSTTPQQHPLPKTTPPDNCPAPQIIHNNTLFASNVIKGTVDIDSLPLNHETKAFLQHKLPCSLQSKTPAIELGQTYQRLQEMAWKVLHIPF